jgi:signal transduction histidine kinase
MKLSYKQKLFLYFLFIFALFTAGILFFEHSRERKRKTETFEEKLDAYSCIINHAVKYYGLFAIDSLLPILPQNIRLTLIDEQGDVFYDNKIQEISEMDNHTHRPEIIAARKKGTGKDIRISLSNEKEYWYYTRKFDDHFVRIALPYDIETRYLLKPDLIFLYYIITLFVVILTLINLVAGRFGKSIRQLRDFALSMENGKRNTENTQFPAFNTQFSNDELGEIGTKIVENFRKLKESEKTIALEREKLLQHVHSSEEGLCFFSSGNAVEFYNALFIQYLNNMTDAAADNDPANVFTDASFEKVSSFLRNHNPYNNYFETKINKHGKSFMVRVNVFDDNSFEIIINDITKQERTRQLKQEMTGNITHELRTPVTGIRGCLETIMEHALEPEKKDYFIKNAYNQVLTLSELIRDMSLITKMEEASQSFKSENVVIVDLLENLKTDFEKSLREKNIEMEWDVTGNVVVTGNRNLLNSIFRNLTDNVIRYAGANVRIFIHIHNEDKFFYYFSYSDTGAGIPGEQHLNRIFERFYRINEGRTRDTGGSGLGLSIVKNAIAFHKGNIIAKNKTGGGLEFLFKLKKKI